MATLICVTKDNDKVRQFCFTDCGPSEGCNPDDQCNPDDSYESTKNNLVK